MCIIIGQVRAVNSTRIFAIPNHHKTRQLTVYVNSVDTPQTNLMILPVPFPQSVEFEETVMGYKNIFQDASKSFVYNEKTYEVMATRSEMLSVSAPLKVFDVGSYKASIALDYTELDKLDQDVFPKVSSHLRQMLEDEYSTRFGFICCVLKKGSAKYEPIAYSHDIYPGKLFLPTKHYHPVEYSGLNIARAVSDDWEHEIYTACTSADVAHRNTYDTIAIPRSLNNMKWQYFPKEFQYLPTTQLNRWECSGEFTNKDLYFPLEFKAPKSAFKTRRPPSLSLEKALSGLRGVFNR